MTLEPHELELGLLTPRHVARLSGFSEKTVLRAIRAGELPASKVRNQYRIWPADYRAWIDGARVEHPATPPSRGPTPTDTASASRLRQMEAGE